MPRLPSALVLLLTATVAHAEVFKCTEPDGRKIYQDRPCTADQKASPYDPAAANLTTIDSEASSREAQEALITRAAGREEPGKDEERPVVYEPDFIPVPVYQPEPVYYPYPVYYDHHPHHGRPRFPHRPDATPMSRPPRGGGGYVPPPPTIRDVAPRPPASPRGGSSRDRPGS